MSNTGWKNGFISIGIMLMLVLLCFNVMAKPPKKGGKGGGSQTQLACSTSHSGDAVLNEILAPGGDTDSFVEIRIMGEDVTIDGWQVCSGHSGNCYTVQDSWTINNSTVVAAAGVPYDNPTYMTTDLAGSDTSGSSGEFVLLDGSGDAIDYLTYGNGNGSNSRECSATNLSGTLWSVPKSCGGCFNDHSASNKDISRSPDGTGGWGDSGSSSTTGTSNSGSSSSLDHFRLSYAGVASSTCNVKALTIQACADSSCSSNFIGDYTLEVKANGSTVNTVTFNDTTTITYGHLSAETVTLSVNVVSASVSPANAYSCDDGNGGTSCQLTFSSTGCSSGAACSASFSDAAANNSPSGNITFNNRGKIVNPDGVIETTQIINNNNSAYKTCHSQGADCIASGSAATALNATFISNTSTTDFTTSSGTLLSNDWQDLTINGTVSANSGFNTHYIRSLTVNASARFTLPSGDYYIGDINVAAGGFINIVSGGSVRIFVLNGMTLNNARVNVENSGDVAKLLIYHHGYDGSAVTISNASEVKGFIYSKGDIQLTGSASVTGGLSGGGTVLIEGYQQVTYDDTAIGEVDFGDLCQSTAASVDHYRFEYAGTGLTCQTQAVVVKACANADCSSLFNGTSTMDLGVVSVGGNQSVPLSFSESSIVNIAEIVPGNVTLSLSNSSPSASLDCVEDGSSGADCIYELKDTGFIFIDNSDGDTDDFPVQIAGKPSDAGYNAHSISLKAVQTDTNTGACASLFSESATVSVDMAYQCTDPGSCTTNVASVSNNSTTTNLSVYPSYNSVDLLFGADSSATMALTYHDVGKIKLYAQKSIVLDASHTAVLNGNTPDILVRPFGLRMAVNSNPAASDASGSIFKKAGENFSVQVDAIAWQIGEDSGTIDGLPDSGDNLTDNPVVLNFGRESSSESVTLTSNVVSPVGGTNGSLSNNAFNQFIDGTQTRTDVNWNEVGVIGLTATNSNYFSSGVALTANVSPVGRFVPDHFTLVSNSMTTGCSSHFMGQDFTLSARIEARGPDETVMSNYVSGVGNDFHGKASAVLVAENDNDGVDLAARLSSFDISWVAGISNDSYNVNFARLTSKANPTDVWMDGPFDNSLIGLQLDDGEPLATLDFASGFNMRADTSSDCASLGNCNAISFNTLAAKVRYARLNSSAVFGPQSDNLTLPLAIEYWDGNKFVISDDSCINLPANLLTVANVNDAGGFVSSYNVFDASDGITDVGDTSIVMSGNTTSTTLTANNGYFDLTLAAPNVIGVVPVSVDLTSFPWLQFDWKTNGTGENETQLPTQNISFGQYRGNDRVIYWREKR